MVYDLITYNGEADTLEIRFNLLNEYVDKFVICESLETFSGRPKISYWAERGDRFEEWEDKVIHLVSNYGEDLSILAMMANRPYVDQESFRRAFYQKEFLRTALKDCADEDVIYYGDVDEVWKPQEIDNKPHKLRQLAYSYFLNNRSPEDWRGTIVTKYKNIREGSLNDLRANPVEADILENGGWHWTNLGGLKSVINKIESYDHQEVNIPWVKDGMAERLALNVDFLGRGFKFWVDDTDLPGYLLENKQRWKKLFKS